MVVDTSALVAILFGEPDAERFAHALGEAPARMLSAVTRVELSFVVEGRKGETGRADLELLLRDGAFDVIAVTQPQAEIANRSVPSLWQRPSPGGGAKHRRLLLLCARRGERRQPALQGQ
jgi:ribonuclease VapC